MDTTPGRAMRDDDHAWTPRQREVLDLLARGKSNQEIADTLGISLDGAKWHMREILSKLDVATREEAADYWRRHNRWPCRRVRPLIFAGVLGRTAALAGVLAAAAAVVGLATVFSDGSDGGASLPKAAAELSPTPTPPPCNLPVYSIPPGAPPVRMAPFLRLNGHTYNPNPNIGALGPNDLGVVLGEVLVEPDPIASQCYRFMDGAAVGLLAGTEVRTVSDYSPSFRVGALVDGQVRLFESSEETAGAAGRDLLDIQGKLTAVELRGYREGNPFTWRTADQQQVASLEQDLLSAHVAAPQPNGYGAWVLTLELRDGSRVVRAYEPRAHYLGAGILLPASFADVVPGAGWE